MGSYGAWGGGGMWWREGVLVRGEDRQRRDTRAPQVPLRVAVLAY